LDEYRGPDSLSLEDQIQELRRDLSAARHIGPATADDFARTAELLKQEVERLDRVEDELTDALLAEGDALLNDELTEYESAGTSAKLEVVWVHRDATGDLLTRVIDGASDLLARCPR
jgi:hypothetical protein